MPNKNKDKLLLSRYSPHKIDARQKPQGKNIVRELYPYSYLLLLYRLPDTVVGEFAQTLWLVVVAVVIE